MEHARFEARYPDSSRFADIDTLAKIIKEGDMTQLISLPGAGRSTTLSLLAYNKPVREKHFGSKQNHIHFVLINCAEVKNKPLFEMSKLIFLTIIDSLKDRGYTNEHEQAVTFFTDALAFQDEMVLFQGLKKTLDMLALAEEVTVVLLLDRFEDYVPMLTKEFFTHLSVLHNRAKYRFSVVFSLNRPLADLVEPDLFSDIAEYIADHITYLSLWDKPSVAFRIGFLEEKAEKTLPQDMIDHILVLTGGHAKLTRLSAQLLLEHDLLQKDERDDLTQVLFEQKTIQIALSEIWLSLNPAEKTHLLKNLYATEYHDEHTAYLANIGLVKDEKLTIPLLQHFVDEQKKKPIDTPASFQYDEEQKEIKKGEQVISDTLTRIEFRALSYLIHHAEKIVERNELIDAVWGENVATIGVTDQALDQVIFRLRRKIEDDPNNPTHLQTVKGRGFRFHP